MRLKWMAAFAACAVLGAWPVQARITKIEITGVESPTFKDAAGAARSFGAVGAYEKLRSKAYGEVDPRDPQNAVITDIELAPKNARGMVEYSTDIYILKPLNLAQGNRKLYMEVNNRGGKLFGGFNGSGGGNNPTSAADAGDAFLMNLGYSMAWSGWDISAAPGGERLTINVGAPLKNADGSAITGPSYEYIVFDNATTTSSALAYPAASLDKSKATLSVRDHLLDAPVPVAAAGWAYNAAGTAITLNGAAFKQGAIYEFSYTAKDPVVAGLGLAATRDFISFLKHAQADDFGNANPLAGAARQAYTFTVSQPARFLNDFQTLGFNADEGGRRVIDGILNWIGAGNGVGINYRFAQPARTERNRQNHRYAEAPFPFAYQKLRDHLTGKVAGRGVACQGERARHGHDDGDEGDEHDGERDHDDDRNRRNTCPKALEVNSANEYWVKTGSLLHTDTRGRSLREPKNVRYYLLSSVEHTVSGAPPNSAGICQQFRNTTDPNPALRALFVALDQWVTQGVKPPRSQVPTRKTGAFSVPLSNGVGVVPQAALGWPNIPGVNYSGLITVRHLFDFGPRFADGILDVNPPDFHGPVYPSFVSKVDADGNEIAGIRLPPVAAPIATTSGWALRSAAFGGSANHMDGCEASGQWIAFKTTQAERVAAGDPRKSLAERYGNHDGYVHAVSAAARKLQKRRLLLEADVQRYIDSAQASSILK
jgi:Alpha/beta hydrolase domain